MIIIIVVISAVIVLNCLFTREAKPGGASSYFNDFSGNVEVTLAVVTDYYQIIEMDKAGRRYPKILEEILKKNEFISSSYLEPVYENKYLE